VTVEETFAKIVGRHASDEERQRLYRLRDALGLRDNDAFWSIVMALEYYDSFFRRYLALSSRSTRNAASRTQRAAFAPAAEQTLSGKVVETNIAIARPPSGEAVCGFSG
jgi:hypothetical protein